MNTVTTAKGWVSFRDWLDSLPQDEQDEIARLAAPGLRQMKLRADLDAAQARITELETSAEELRRACAQVLGYNADTWPDHGNAPLAICAALAVRENRVKELAEVAAVVCDIAADWNLDAVDVEVPIWWNAERNEDGWPLTRSLAAYFKSKAGGA